MRAGGAHRLPGFMVPGASPGVQLDTLAYVHRPVAGETRAPTLIIRTAYGKNMFESLGIALFSQGFNLVMQDCRGCFGSTGVKSFGANEDIDGVACLNWLAEHCTEWFDPARVVMWGISYLGITAWAAVKGLADLNPDNNSEDGLSSSDDEDAASSAAPSAPGVSLCAIAPLMSGSNLYTLMFDNGVFNMDFYFRYLWTMGYMNSAWDFIRLIFKEKLFNAMIQRETKQVASVRSLHARLQVPRIFKFNPWPRSNFWQERNFKAAAAATPPAFVASGWFDMFLECALQDYERLAREQRNVCEARLMVGNWIHIDGPSEAIRASVAFLQKHVGLETPKSGAGGTDDTAWATAEEGMPVRLWVMGPRAAEGMWRNFETWPPPADEWLFTLGAGSLSCLNMKDAGLTPHRKTGQKSSTFVTDPQDPTPMRGGTLFHKSEAGEFEQSYLLGRHDVLAFDSGPLEEDLVVAGRARVRLAVKTSKQFFDIVARLIDVHPDGSSFNVVDGCFRKTKQAADQRRPSLPTNTRTSFKGGSSEPGAAEGQDQDQMEMVEVTFWGTAKRFLAGHRLRLLVAGSSHPRLARNFHDDGQAVDDEPFYVEPCQVEVMHGAEVASELFLPVVEPKLQKGQALLAKTASRSSKISTRRNSDGPPQKADLANAAQRLSMY